MRLVLASLVLLACAACAQPSVAGPRIGDTYEVTLTRDSQQQATDGASGSSHDQDTLVERVIGVRSDGVELEYDLPSGAPKEERASTWQFPARVFRPWTGPVQLLNRPELETRIDAWLKSGNVPRSACGHLIFTWNAFRIECDPDAVIKAVEAFELPTIIREGAPYSDPDALIPAALTKKNAGPHGATFVADMKIDPNAVRRAKAETDVGVGEIMNKPVTLDDALARHANDDVSGTISVNLDTDASGQVWRRKTVTVVKIKRDKGQSETEITTTALERRRVKE